MRKSLSSPVVISPRYLFLQSLTYYIASCGRITTQQELSVSLSSLSASSSSITSSPPILVAYYFNSIFNTPATPPI